ncbi:MAG: hypothetical protein PHC95_15755 [Parabacteroides sp.]|nr:hypothetical protein [Parabacteroides sp.]
MTQKPKAVDLSSSATRVYLRKNIISVPNVDADGNELTTTHWNYDEANLTPEEYEEYMAELENPSTQLIMQTLSDLQLQIDELAL